MMPISGGTYFEYIASRNTQWNKVVACNE